MEYIREGFTLPVPFNLIPTPITTYYSIKEWREKRKEVGEKRGHDLISNVLEEQPSIIDIRPQTLIVNGSIKMSEFSKVWHLLNLLLLEFFRYFYYALKKKVQEDEYGEK
jgi:hypothetical protein